MDRPVYVVTRDGVELFRGTYSQCLAYIHRAQSQSIHWAITYEGWAINPA